MNIDKILNSFKIDVVCASLCRMNTTASAYHDYVEKSKKIAAERIAELIKNIVCKRYNSDPPQNDYARGMECVYRIMERRIAKLI